MLAYIVRRILYAVPILVCVNIFTFILFFFVNTPDDVAYMVLGGRNTQPIDVYRWKREHDYHLPKLINVRDTIVHVSTASEVPTDFGDRLRGYRVLHCTLQTGTDDAAAKSRLDALRLSADAITGNTVIVLDPTDVDETMSKMAFAAYFPKGVPFIVLDNGDEALRQRLTSPNLAFVPPARVREAVDQLHVKGLGIISETLFFKKSIRLFVFDFGKSDRENVDISYQIGRRMWPSLLITVPAFILGMSLNIFLSMIVAHCRGTFVDRGALIICIMMISIHALFYIFGVQLYFGVFMKLFPVSGYLPGFDAIRFMLLPIIISVIIGIGGDVRFYRTVFLEEINRDYIRTARSKGLSEGVILFKHALRNSLLPILTNSVVAILMLFTGSLLLESFFAIPGLGSFTLDAIQAQDFRIVGAMAYLGSFLFIIGLILTDISYTIADPRVRLE